MRSERGQSTIEWIALVLLIALAALAALALAGARFPGAELARSIAGKLLCAVDVGDCATVQADPVESAYGAELAEIVRGHVPDLVYEPGMVSMPVDFRDCREESCAVAELEGEIERSSAGNPATAFLHVVDCREDAGGSDAAGEEASYDCTGDRAGQIFVQYWFYYPASETRPFGRHDDDWESMQLRIDPDGVVHVRASSHHGYNHGASVANAASDAGGILGPVNDVAEEIGLRPEGGWGPETHHLFVSAMSHAGNATNDYEPVRTTDGDSLRLIPIESLGSQALGTRFAVTAPWLKEVWSDPLSDST